MWDNDFCHAVIDASLYWTGADEANCPALKYLRTMAGYYLWDNAGRPTPKGMYDYKLRKRTMHKYNKTTTKLLARSIQ